MANEYTFGQKLQGIGAALSGTIPQFQQEMQQLSEARTKAMYQDAGAAYQMLQSGNLGGIIDLADDRLSILRRLPGADTSYTENVKMLAQRALYGDAGAKSELASILEQAQITGVQLGYVKAPAAEEARVLKPGDRLVGPSGNIITEYTKPQDASEAPPDFSLGNKRYTFRGANGEILSQPRVIAESLTPSEAPPDFSLGDARYTWRGEGGQILETPRVIAERPKDDRPSEREARIADLMATFGIDRKQAISAIETETFMNPETGGMMTYNPMTREAKALETAIPYQPEFFEQFPEVTPEMLSFDVKKGTGMFSSALSLYDRTIGQVSPIQIPREYKEAEQVLRTLQRDAVRALSSSSRPPVMEMQQIARIIPQPNQYLENPETAQFQLLSFIDIMGTQYIQDLRDSRNPNSSRQVRAEAETRMSRIRSTLGLLLAPQALDTVFSSITATEEEIGDILNMSIEELRKINVSSLTDAQIDAVLNRLETEQ